MKKNTLKKNYQNLLNNNIFKILIESLIYLCQITKNVEIILRNFKEKIKNVEINLRNFKEKIKYFKY